MFTIAMFCPTEPRSDSLFVLLIRYALNLVQPDYLFTKILLNALANQLLFAEELIPDKIKDSPMSVVTVRGDREHLPVSLHRQLQLVLDIRLHKPVKELMQPLLALAVEREIVGIFLAVYLPDLVHLVHEITQKQIGEIL